MPPALERDRVPAHAAARRPDHLYDEVPRRVTQAVDILWLGHMLCEQYYSPPEKPFEMTLKLLDIEKAEA